MSVGEPQPMVGAYVMNSHHTSIHDVPTASLSSETSSTSSDVEGQMVAMKSTPTPVVMENGPEMYASDASVENQQPATTPYMNGPAQNASYSPEYEPQVDGQTQVEYPVQGQEFVEGQLEYATAPPGQEYIAQDQMQQVPTTVGEYTGNGNSVDYQNQVQMGEDVNQGQVQDGGQNSGGQGQRRYVFYLQITAGEAFPVGNGDQVQYIHGPTLIQLVSNSPNPPPLHTVQTGHGPVSMGNNLPVISAPSPMPVGVTMQQAPVQDNGDGGMQPAHSPATMMYNTVNVPQSAPAAVVAPQQMYGPPPMYTHPGTGGVYPHMMGYPNAGLPPHVHPHVATAVPVVGAGVPPRVRIHHYQHAHVAPLHGAPQCTVTDHSHHVQEPQHRPTIQRSRSKDDRTEKQREKLQRKLRERERNKDSSYGSLTPSPQTSPRGSLNSNSLKSQENDARMNSSRQSKKRHNSREKIEEQHEDPHSKKLRDILSDIKAPELCDITAHTALGKWSFPPAHANNGDCRHDNNINLSNVSFELLLADMSRNGLSRSIYSAETQRMVTDLKPATEYHISVSAILDEVRGVQSQATSFETQGCAPDAPMIPRLTNKTKSSLMLKWNAPNSNGAKIHMYMLQCDKGNGGDGFVTVFEGCEKQHRVLKLQPSTQYRFRLQAINDHGASPFSPEVTYYTSGSAPSTPEPPTLIEALARSLKLQWQKSAGDVSGYILEMDDESKRYGFQTVYRGEDTRHCCRSLSRNSEYKFRLCAFNDEGNSKWSSVVAFSTLPDVPRSPSKPTVKGKVHSTNFRVIWEPPRDSGGSEITSYTLEMSSGLNGSFIMLYEGFEREYLCDSLNPGQTYRLRVFCTSRGGESQCSDVCSTTTLPVCPGQCITPKLHGRPKASSLSLRWAQPEYDGGSQVTEFAVEMLVIEDSSTKEVHRGAPTITECLVNGLLPGRQYSFKVRAFNRVGGGPFSESLQTTTGAGPPDAPDPPMVMCRSATTAYVTWEKPCCNGAEITEYRLEKASENDSFSLVYTGATPSCELKSLQPATFYYLRIQAINPAGPGPFSEVETCKTPPSSPESVPTLRLLSSTSDSLLIQWLEPSNCGEEIIAYNIDIGEAQPLAVGNVTEYCIDQLQPDTKYRIRIQAANCIGVGPYSAVLKAVTKALPPQPPKLECALYSHQSLKLKWAESSRVDAKILNYTLEMEDKKGRFIVVYSGANTSHKVTRLTEQMSYKFRVCASNDAGSGPYSEEYIFSTTKAPPPCMKAPKVSDITEDSGLVEWMSLGTLQGDTIIYQCHCQRSRESESKLVYRGPNTSVHLHELTPNTEYRLRVCAVRLPQDGGQDLCGAYSQWELFQTRSNEPTETVIAETESEVKVERKPISDQQLAAICLSVFFLSAILFAVILQWFIAN